MVSGGKGRLFGRKDGKCLLYVTSFVNYNSFCQFIFDYGSERIFEINKWRRYRAEKIVRTTSECSITGFFSTPIK